MMKEIRMLSVGLARTQQMELLKTNRATLLKERCLTMTRTLVMAVSLTSRAAIPARISDHEREENF
jgi:hypothetical protein